MVILINDLKRHNSSLETELENATIRVIRSGWYILGTEVESFEREFASYCGVGSCVTVANGTDALELALRALGVGAGDEVITVANAGMYSTTAILAVGAQPIFADIDPNSLTLSVTSFENAITKNTKAVIATHLYGQMADMQGLLAAAHKSRIVVIEDCAQAHGAKLAGKRAGSWGDLACFSFYPTKNLGALGDGGAVVTSNDQLADRLKQLRQYGWKSKYCSIIAGGRNSRLDEIQAAILRAKLPRLDDWNKRRREIAKAYATGIQNPNIHHPSSFNESYVAHLYVLRTDKRDSLRLHLKKNGIASDIHYPLLDYQQPFLEAHYPKIHLPHTKAAAAKIMTLPCFPEMTEAEVRQVIDAVNKWDA